MIFEKLRDRYSMVQFRLVDGIALSYLALMAALLLPFHRQVAAWPRDFVIHLVLIGAVLEILRHGSSRPRSRVAWALRHLYPIALIAYGYAEIERLQLMFFGSFWASEVIAKLDVMMFGAHPTVVLGQFYRPGLDEVMAFHNVSYYLFLPLVVIPFYLRRDSERLLAALAIVSLTYFANYLLFALFPALSPRMIPWLSQMHENEYTGYFFGSFIHALQGESGTVRGGAFPSSHVSASLAWALAAWRYNRKIGYVLLALVPGIALSTVYLRYHHAADPLFGLVLALACYALALRWLKARGEDPNGLSA